MALQAPERRGNTLEEDLERAFALSRADKKLGEYFPPIENSTHAWHYDGTEHSGGGFDADMYAFRTRGQLKKEWEVSVVQWAREREDADKGWEAEQAARNAQERKEDRKMKTIWAPEEADVLEAKKEVEQAWAREQLELEGLLPTSKKERRKTVEYANVATPINAKRLSETLYRPNLGEESPVARTSAWLNGTGERVGVREHRADHTEPNELYTMDTYEEELRMKRRGERTPKTRPHSGRYQSPIRRPSTASSTNPPSLPSKVLYQAPESEVSMSRLETPRSELQTMSVSRSRDPTQRVGSRASKTSDASKPIPVSEPSTVRPPRRRSLLSIVSAPQTEEASIPPTLPSKRSGRGSPDSMETESRQSPRSIPDDEDFEEYYEYGTEAQPESLPEAIHIYSPTVEENKSAEDLSTGVKTRPTSTLSRLMPTFAEDEKPIAQERPLSFPVLATDSHVDLKGPLEKSQGSLQKLPEPEVHVISEASSWRNFPPPETTSNNMLFDETAIPGMTGASDPSMTTLVGAERLVSPSSGIAQSFRQLALEAANDPTNPNYLRDMNFTVPAMFSRSALSHEVLPEESENASIEQARDELVDVVDEFPTPKRMPSSMPHGMRLPTSSVDSTQPVNVEKSLPATPFTDTHSVVSAPEFDSDGLGAARRADEVYYYDHYRQSLPPEYSSGSKTPRGSMQKTFQNSLDSLKQLSLEEQHRKSIGSLRSIRTGSTGAMGDAEPDEILNPVRGAERRPSKRSSKHRKHGGSQGSSDGSGSTVKASVHGRSQSSDDGYRSRSRQERNHERTPSSHRHGTHRVKGQLPPGSAHTRVTLSDSESAPEEALKPASNENFNPSVESSPLSVDSSESGGQYVVVPEHSETGDAGPTSAHTFGFPSVATQTFLGPGEWRTPQDVRNDSKGSLPLNSRPQSMAPSTRSNRTRTSTLRASLRSPLPDISERDTTSELSYGDGNRASGSFGRYNTTGPSNEQIAHIPPGEEQTPMERLGMHPAWRADLWGSVAWDAAAAKRASSSRPRTGLNRFVGAAPGGGAAGGNGSKSSSSSLGEELQDNFALEHPPGSYHASNRNSMVQNNSSGVEDHQHASSSNNDQGSSGSKQYMHNVGELVDWHEDTEVGMAGVGAHGIRSKVSYRPPSPQKSENWDD